MKLEKVIVVFKKTLFQLYGKEKKDPSFLKLLRTKHKTVQRLGKIHTGHRGCIAKTKEILDELGIDSKFIYRASHYDERHADLILSVGGDGTFLEAAQYASKKPILGLNSNPKDSVGMYCGITIHELKETLLAIKEDKLKPIELQRLRITLSGKKIAWPILNDILISHTNPAATSRFLIQWRNKEERVRCSGMWISPPAGSTGATRSAGGKILPLKSNKFQFVIREPYEAPGERLPWHKGIVSKEERLVLHSKMRQGGVYLDGSHRRWKFSLGEKLVVEAKGPTLKVFAYNEKRRKLFEK